MKPKHYSLAAVALLVAALAAACSAPAPVAPTSPPSAPTFSPPPTAQALATAAPAIQPTTANPVLAPICQASTSCEALNAEQIPLDCVKKVPYVNVLVPPGTNYEVLDKSGDFVCDDTGMVVNGKQVLTCRGKVLFSFQLKLTNAACDSGAQERIISLWEDVAPTIAKTKPPEPFVIRFNTFDCGKYLHTNLVPEAFEVDDYQVRTPTDIIGQHIHLPKWDLSATDGSGNGWNYEDGTLSPGAVRERIHAINCFNGTGPCETGAAPGPGPVATLDGRTQLHPQPHPFFGAGPISARYPEGLYAGARTTIQRWFFDPVVNASGVDRGLGIIFTHDHYGPSTHQQIGLYASVLTEPANSTWVHNETGVALNTRADGGPTTWQAVIKTGDVNRDGKDDSFREFWYQASDFQHAYENGVYVGAGPDGVPNGVKPDANSFRFTVNPNAREQVNPVLPDLVLWSAVCPAGLVRPCPEAISVADPGMFVVNYRNEPVGLRIFDPAKLGPDGKPGAQADGIAGDLGYALSTFLAFMAGAQPIRATSVIPSRDASGNILYTRKTAIMSDATSRTLVLVPSIQATPRSSI